MDFETFLVKLTGPGGAFVILTLVVIGLLRKILVPGWVYQDKELEVTFWRARAERAIEQARAGTQVAQDTVDIAKEAVAKRR